MLQGSVDLGPMAPALGGRSMHRIAACLENRMQQCATVAPPRPMISSACNKPALVGPGAAGSVWPFARSELFKLRVNKDGKLLDVSVLK